jgi:nitroreductase
VELLDVLRANPSIREFTNEPVSDQTLAEMLDVARFAPSGGNRQPWHVAVIKDVALRRQLADLCGPVWSEYMALAAAGDTPFNVARPSPVDLAAASRSSFPNPVLDDIEAASVVLIVAADLGSVAMMDKDLGRACLTGGASVYPFVQNLLLAARAHDLGGVMTTFLARAEREARPLLGLPDDWAIASMVVLGHPRRRPTRLSRQPVSEFATVDRFDGPVFEP